MRRAANIDKNHSLIVNALRGRGATVQSLAAVGKGCPDLLIGYQGRTLLAEVKAFPASTEKGRLSDDQVQWHREWRGHVAIIRSVEDLVWFLEKGD